MDKFVHVWEGGCRAGGAAWKSSHYTREGLTDVSQIALDIDTSEVSEHARKFRGKVMEQSQHGNEKL